MPILNSFESIGYTESLMHHGDSPQSHRDPQRNLQRFTKKPTEIHCGPESYELNKRSNIKIADASMPSTVYFGIFSKV